MLIEAVSLAVGALGLIPVFMQYKGLIIGDPSAAKKRLGDVLTELDDAYGKLSEVMDRTAMLALLQLEDPAARLEVQSFLENPHKLKSILRRPSSIVPI